MSVTDIPGPRYFGDESGNFRGLLQGNEQYFGVAVVKGTAIDCARCPKRAVRRANSVDEARWTDLTDTQRRRIASCIQSVDGIDGAYVRIERDDIHKIPNNYVLQQDSLPYDNEYGRACRFLWSSNLGVRNTRTELPPVHSRSVHLQIGIQSGLRPFGRSRFRGEYRAQSLAGSTRYTAR